MGSVLLYFAKTVFLNPTHIAALRERYARWQKRTAGTAVVAGIVAYTRMLVTTTILAALLLWGAYLASVLWDRLLLLLRAFDQVVAEKADTGAGETQQEEAPSEKPKSLQEAIYNVMSRAPVDEPESRPVSTTEAAGQLATFFRTTHSVQVLHDKFLVTFNDEIYTKKVKPKLLEEARDAYLTDLLTGQTEQLPLDWLHTLSDQRVESFAQSAEESVKADIVFPASSGGAGETAVPAP